MIRIKSDLKPYAIEVPTAISEIDERYFKALLNDVKIANNYAIIAICYKDRLFSILSDFKSGNNGTKEVVPIIAKIQDNESKVPFAVGDLAVVDTSSLERGTHLSLRNNAICFGAICEYCLSDSELSKAIMNGSFFNGGKSLGAHEAKMAAPDVFFVEFKIVPLCDIKASYSRDANIACTKVEHDKSNLN